MTYEVNSKFCLIQRTFQGQMDTDRQDTICLPIIESLCINVYACGLTYLVISSLTLQGSAG